MVACISHKNSLCLWGDACRYTHHRDVGLLNRLYAHGVCAASGQVPWCVVQSDRTRRCSGFYTFDGVRFSLYCYQTGFSRYRNLLELIERTEYFTVAEWKKEQVHIEIAGLKPWEWKRLLETAPHLIPTKLEQALAKKQADHIVASFSLIHHPETTFTVADYFDLMEIPQTPKRLEMVQRAVMEALCLCDLTLLPGVLRQFNGSREVFNAMEAAAEGYLYCKDSLLKQVVATLSQ